MKYLFYSFIAVMFPYLGLSFIKLDMNVAHWDMAERGVLVFLYFFVVFLLNMGVFDKHEEVT